MNSESRGIGSKIVSLMIYVSQVDVPSLEKGWLFLRKSNFGGNCNVEYKLI